MPKTTASSRTASPKPAVASRSSFALRGIRLFEGLSTARLDALAQHSHWQQLPAHKQLLSRGQDPGDVYFLVSGAVRVTTFSANGRQVTFSDVESGQYFGDLAALDGQPRSAEVHTLMPSVVASLDRAAFRALLQAEPLVAERVMLKLVTLVRALSERVIELSTLGVQNRLHAELLRRARLAGVADNQAVLQPAPRHAELASQVSTNREQVTRELSVLARQGLLIKEGKALRVTDLARLERLVAEVRGA